MSLSGVLKSEEEKLRKIAVNLADNYLMSIERPKVISLRGFDWEILGFLQQQMQTYLAGRGEEVTVRLGNDGYVINVGLYLQTFPNSFAQ